MLLNYLISLLLVIAAVIVHVVYMVRLYRMVSRPPDDPNVYLDMHTFMRSGPAFAMKRVSRRMLFVGAWSALMVAVYRGIPYEAAILWVWGVCFMWVGCMFDMFANYKYRRSGYRSAVFYGKLKDVTDRLFTHSITWTAATIILLFYYKLTGG